MRLTRYACLARLCLALIVFMAAPAVASSLPPELRPGLTLGAVTEWASTLDLRMEYAGRLPDGSSLIVGVRAGDDCSPRAAYLLCPGLRVIAEDASPEARVAGLSLFTRLPASLTLAAAAADAIARYGSPHARESVVEQRRGLDMLMEVLRWSWRDKAPPIEVEVSLVLDSERGVTGIGVEQVLRRDGLR